MVSRRSSKINQQHFARTGIVHNSCLSYLKGEARFKAFSNMGARSKMFQLVILARRVAGCNLVTQQEGGCASFYSPFWSPHIFFFYLFILLSIKKYRSFPKFSL